MLNRMEKRKLYHQPGYKPNEKLKSRQASDLMYSQPMKLCPPVNGKEVIIKDNDQQTRRMMEITGGEKVISLVMCKHRVTVIRATIHKDMQADTVESMAIDWQREDCIQMGETTANTPLYIKSEPSNKSK